MSAAQTDAVMILIVFGVFVILDIHYGITSK